MAMPTQPAFRCLGKVTVVAATPTPLVTAFSTLPIAGMMVRAIIFSAGHGNTGRIYIGDRSLASGSPFTGVAVTLAIPGSNQVGVYSFESQNDNNNIPVEMFSVGGTVDNDVCYVSVLVG